MVPLLKRFHKSYFKLATLIRVIAKQFPRIQRNVPLVFKNLSSSAMTFGEEKPGLEVTWLLFSEEPLREPSAAAALAQLDLPGAASLPWNGTRYGAAAPLRLKQVCPMYSGVVTDSLWLLRVLGCISQPGPIIFLQILLCFATEEMTGKEFSDDRRNTRAGTQVMSF